MKILVTVFACSPQHGSEPGIGWGWIVALSNLCDLTVLTTTCNRPGIEEYQKKKGKVSAQFIYEDVSSVSQRLNLKGKGKVGVFVRLLLWQRRIKYKLAELVNGGDYDVLHHITLGAFRLPFSVVGYGSASVVGPVGGCELFPPHLFPEKGFKVKVRELARNIITQLYVVYGYNMARFKKADLTLSCTKEMSRVFAKWGVNSPVFPNIGMHHEQVLSEPKQYRQIGSGGGLKLLFVGNLLYWKGLELAVLALESLPNDITLCCVGEGADRATFEALIKKRNLGHRVELLGSVARDELLEKYATYDIFLFPSLHDSGGMAVIEAMRAGLPVICLDAGGPGVSVTSDCGHVVSLGPKRDVVARLRDAIIYYQDHPHEIAAHGENARRRVAEEYNWSKNALRMLGYYKSMIEK
ncbi:MAG: glycosyltransferase family 4 protein [Akkermansiaceae bacterium]